VRAGRPRYNCTVNAVPVVIEVANLRKQFEGVTALADVSFNIKRGEIVGLLGANGAGKTTLIHILLGLLSPASGTVRMLNMDINTHRIQILDRCNFSSAYIRLPYNLTVWENLMVFARLYAIPDAAKRITELITLFGVDHLKTKLTSYLSSGEQTRVNLCKALLNKPEILLLDEPTASLDPDIADKVRKLIRHVQQTEQTTILYTSHNMRDIEELCDRVLFLHKGSILAQGTPTTILEEFSQTSLEDVFINIARGGEVQTAEAES
jgi:ABC-2 type transport system ATP-binding protein